MTLVTWSTSLSNKVANKASSSRIEASAIVTLRSRLIILHNCIERSISYTYRSLNESLVRNNVRIRHRAFTYKTSRLSAFVTKFRIHTASGSKESDKFLPSSQSEDKDIIQALVPLCKTPHRKFTPLGEWVKPIGANTLYIWHQSVPPLWRLLVLNAHTCVLLCAVETQYLASFAYVVSELWRLPLRASYTLFINGGEITSIFVGWFPIEIVYSCVSRLIKHGKYTRHSVGCLHVSFMRRRLIKWRSTAFL